jgi:WD40 repeat protein
MKSRLILHNQLMILCLACTTGCAPKSKRGEELLYLDGHHDRAVGCVSYSPDGKRLASAGSDGTVKIWDAETGKQLRSLEGHTDQVFCAVFSPDGNWIASAGIDKTVKIWDAETGRELKNLEGHTQCVDSVAFSPDGKRIASAADDRTVKVWDLEKSQILRTFKARSSISNYVVFHPDGKRLVSASLEGIIQIWDLEKVHEALVLNTLHTVNSVAISPNGKQLASATGNAVKVWDVDKGKELFTVEGHQDEVSCVAFSSDGKLLASGSRDKTVKVWDVEKRQELLTLKGHTAMVGG